jgi:ATP-dependent RNA helicase RhlB
VRQVLYFPSTEEKIPLLIGLLRRIDAQRTMVFVNTRRIAEVLERTLTANGFVAQALSGDVPQTKRLKMMRDFHNGDVAVLIATDVASRGLHIPDVSHVFNFDLPNDPEDYVHRIGRTARAGAEGDALSFGCEEYAVGLPDIERYIGHQIPRASIDSAELAAVIAPPPAEWRERAPRSGPSRGGGGRSGGGPRSGGGNRPGGRPAGGHRRPGASSHAGQSHAGQPSHGIQSHAGQPSPSPGSQPPHAGRSSQGGRSSHGGRSPQSGHSSQGAAPGADPARAPDAGGSGGDKPAGERPARRRRRRRGGGSGGGAPAVT